MVDVKMATNQKVSQPNTTTITSIESPKAKRPKRDYGVKLGPVTMLWLSKEVDLWCVYVDRTSCGWLLFRFTKTVLQISEEYPSSTTYGMW